MRRVLLIGVNEDISGGYIQRLIDEAEAEFLDGKQSDIVPTGMMTRTFELSEPLLPAFPISRRGKGERKRNRKHRWGGL